MTAPNIKTIDDFYNSIPSFPKDFLELSESSRNLLQIIYKRAIIIPESHLKSPLKPPLIINFHPKASLLNNNIHETSFAKKLANKLGKYLMKENWINQFPRFPKKKINEVFNL